MGVRCVLTGFKIEICHKEVPCCVVVGRVLVIEGYMIDYEMERVRSRDVEWGEWLEMMWVSTFVS
jgi:hypothetical protein